MKISIETNIDDDAVFSVYVDACELAIGYWCQFNSYRCFLQGTNVEDVLGFGAIIEIEPMTDDDNEETCFTIDRDVVIDGITRCATGENVAYLGDRTRNVARAILFGDPEWSRDHDAITADQIVQVGLFGEVVYG